MKDPRRRAINDFERIEQNIASILSRVDEVCAPIRGWQWREGRHTAPREYKYLSPWRAYNSETVWGGDDATAWFRADAVIPKEMSGREVWARMKPGGEAIIRVNGRPVGGLDFSHTEILLSKSARAGARFHIELECYFRDAPDDSIRGEVKKSHQFKIAELVVKDRDVEGLYYDLLVALDMARALASSRPDLSEHFTKSALHAASLVDPYETDRAAYRRGAFAARKYLAAALFSESSERAAGTIHLVGSCHLDLLFVWPYRESVRKNLRTNLIAARLMERFREYRFGQTQAKLFADMKRYHPREYALVKSLVRAGRFEPIGDMWVEADGNIPCGEALVRQILYGRKLFEREFGTRSTVCWWSDVFGVTASLPQLLAQAGYRLYYSGKHCVWHDTNEFPHGTFWWEGIDGTRLMAHFPPTHFVGLLTPESILLQWNLYQQKDEAPHVMYTYGFGDGGGGPTEKMLEYARRLSKMEGTARLKMSSAEEFVDALTATAHDLPVWPDELYLEMHRGAQTSRGDLKWKNRRAESTLRAAEIASSIAAITRNARCPSATLEDLWKSLLDCHFHDAVTGTHNTDAVPDVVGWYDRVLAGASEITRTALAARTGKASAPAVTVANFTGQARSGHVFWRPSDAGKKALARNSTLALDGEALATQRLRDGRLVTFIPRLPALGKTTLGVIGAKARRDARFKLGARAMRSGRYSIRFGANGLIESIRDLAAGREVLAAPGNEFRLFEDKPGRFEAWEIAKDYESRPIDAVRFERLGDGECGPVLARRVLMWKVGSSSVRQEVVLYHDSPRIDFRTEIDWREDRKLLRVYFPLAVLARSATYEIAFGTIDRPTRTTNPFDLAKFEVPFHRWFDVSEPGYGVSILNDGKYGGAVKDSVASISLLKAPKFPDPTSDMGRHVFTYSLLPHQGDWRDAGTFAEALILNTPLEAFPGRPGDASAAWLDVSRPGVQVEALKKAEDGKGYILRLVDYYGRTGRVRVTLPRAPRSVRPCTITEEASDEDVSVRGAAISFTMRPYAVRSFRILFA